MSKKTALHRETVGKEASFHRKRRGMRALTFSLRTAREILRDPLTLCFGLGFPLVLLLLLSAIQKNIPAEAPAMFEISRLTPGITVFGLSFMTLFSSLLLARDRESAFLARLYTSPMTASDFVFGYALPMLPMALCQSMICYLAALIWGLKPSVNILLAVIFILPTALFYIALGLICGSVMNSKQVGGICGALLTNLSAWLSGIWFDIALLGGTFERIAGLLPFVHMVELERAVLASRFDGIFPHLWWVLGYTAAAVIGAVQLFLRQMKRL